MSTVSGMGVGGTSDKDAEDHRHVSQGIRMAFCGCVYERNPNSHGRGKQYNFLFLEFNNTK